jgi:hypothetical protein
MMEWTEPDWCEFVSGPFKAEIYPLEDGFSPGWTLTLRINGTGDEDEFKNLAERIEAFLEDDALQQLTNKVGLEYAQVMNDPEKLKEWMETP